MAGAVATVAVEFEVVPGWFVVPIPESTKLVLATFPFESPLCADDFPGFLGAFVDAAKVLVRVRG